MYRFNGKTILVTGAGSGMGAACMRRLHDEGATVVAMDLNMEGIDRYAQSIEDRGRLHAVRVDIADHGAVASAVAEVADRVGNLYGW